MKPQKIALIALLSVNLLAYSQENIIELSLIEQNGNNPFSIGYLGMTTSAVKKNAPWISTYPKILRFPKGLFNIKYNYFDTNRFQSVYQDYLLGNITKEQYEEIQNRWDWTPDTANLSKTPMKTKIAYAYGRDWKGKLKMVIDTNNNLDLRDDKVFEPVTMNSIDWSNVDLAAYENTVNVSFETFIQNNIVNVNIPLSVYRSGEIFMSSLNFPQYFTSQFKGEQLAVCLSQTRVAFINDLKVGDKARREDVYRMNDLIEIMGDVYKILGVNTNMRTLILEKIDLPKSSIFSSQAGYKAHLFNENEFTTQEPVSLESFRGKYVLIDFWADWCAPCIAEFPHLKELYSITDRAKFEIIGIAGRSTPNGVKSLIEQHELTWYQIFSDDIVNMYEIVGYPTTILIDPDGIIIEKNLGGKGKELVERILNLIE